MQNRNLLAGMSILFLAAFFSGCAAGLHDAVTLSGSPEQVGRYWKMKDVRISSDSLVLEKTSSAMVSKFSAVNFELKLRMLTTPGAEGSIAFHTTADNDASAGYRVMINNSDYRSGNAQKTGSLSLIRNFFIRMIDDNEWFDMTVAVYNNKIKVSVNNVVVSEYTQPENPVRMEGLEGMVISGGRIVISKSGDPGRIIIGRISLDPLPDDFPAVNDNFETTDAVARTITLLNQQGFPLIDYHGHVKGTLTNDQVARYGRDNGYNYGIAPNCGLNFPVTNDSTLNAYYDGIADEPMFKAMQCEGREWVTLFTPGPVSRYDYIYTDAGTFTDLNGKRITLWGRYQVNPGEESQFMDMLVDKIVAIVSKEPIDIYVNPTYIPSSLNARYDELWTEERMDRVIQALVENDVALEINARFRIPSIAFVKRAKAAGVKFTVGTNNAGANDLGRLEYCLDVIREAGLTPEDMFLPKPAGDKKVMKMGIPSAITG